MRTYVGVTDNTWARFLASSEATEANFWFPSPKTGFAALRPGEPFLFKTHYPDNRLVGGGFFEHYTVLKASEAWAFMGTGNGAASLGQMLQRIRRYRPEAKSEYDPEIGCVILNDLVFFGDHGAIGGPKSFARSIVRGKTYRDPREDSAVEAALGMLLGGTAPVAFTEATVRRRLGQGGFQAVVLDAYDARCAITRHRIRPTLQAAHIRPVAEGGPHDIGNGLLLRSDVHTMFDRGYLALTDDHRLLVSPRLREEFGNGEEFYARAGDGIAVPKPVSQRPAGEFLQWHRDTVFRASA